MTTVDVVDTQRSLPSGADTVAGLAAALGEARRRLADGDAADLAALARDVDAVLAADRVSVLATAQVIGLIDELELMVEELDQAQGWIAEQIRAAMRHKKAGNAYSGSGRQP